MIENALLYAYFPGTIFVDAGLGGEVDRIEHLAEDIKLLLRRGEIADMDGPSAVIAWQPRHIVGVDMAGAIAAPRCRPRR